MEGKVKGETQDMNEPFGKKTDFDFEVSLGEETIPSHRSVWNHWIGNGNSGMDAVGQDNGIDKTQLSKDHLTQQKKRSWKIETTWNLIQEMEAGTHLNKKGIQNDTVWLYDFRDVASVTTTQMCSLKVPTTASWRNGSCNGPTALFKTMWTRYGCFGELEVCDDIWESDRSIDEKKLGFCYERSSRIFYKQNGKRNSTALQLLGENPVVATENDVPESREPSVVPLLGSKYISIPIGCTEITEHKGGNFSCRNVGSSLHLLIMMMDDSTMFPREQIQNSIMGRM